MTDTNDLKEVIKSMVGIFGILFIIWLGINGLRFIIGCMDANYTLGHCDTTYRIDYVFPGRLLGCYMGRPVNDR